MWPFRRRAPSCPSPDAVAARKRAEAALAAAQAETPRLRTLAAQLREVQQRNHLAEAFEHTLRGTS
jgi:hypothetical protein